MFIVDMLFSLCRCLRLISGDMMIFMPGDGAADAFEHYCDGHLGAVIREAVRAAGRYGII